MGLSRIIFYMPHQLLSWLSLGCRLLSVQNLLETANLSISLSDFACDILALRFSENNMFYKMPFCLHFYRAFP